MKSIQFQTPDKSLCFHHAVQQVLQDLGKEKSYNNSSSNTLWGETTKEGLWCTECMRIRNAERLNAEEE